MIMYKRMMEQARKDGVTSEKSMWASIEAVDDLLDVVEEEHPELYKKFIRRQHCALYGPHFNETLAEDVVEGLRYTDKDGKTHTGEYWSVEAVEAAVRPMSFPSTVTKWDKYVAFNAFRAAVGPKIDDSTVLQMGYAFFFADDNFQGENKVWCYVNNLY